jgi:hypothetical protein
MIGTKGFIKCPVCTSIFGTLIGDMPQGTMTEQIDNKLTCQGHPPGTIVITYSFNGCQRNNISIPGTSRMAYLPNTPEGK